MTTIAVTTGKGGVGKTTMACHLAAGLAMRGKRVGLIDTDPQGACSYLLGLEPVDGLANLLVKGESLAFLLQDGQIVQRVVDDCGGLWLLPSYKETAMIPYKLGGGEVFLFLETTEAFRQHLDLDVVIIDTQPSINPFDSLVFMATDQFLFVTECEGLALRALGDAVEQMHRFAEQRQKYLSKSCGMLGIIPNKLRPNTVLHREMIAKAAQGYPEKIWDPVTLRTTWAEAATLGELVFSYGPESQAAHDAWGIVERVGKELWPTNATG